MIITIKIIILIIVVGTYTIYSRDIIIRTQPPYYAARPLWQEGEKRGHNGAVFVKYILILCYTRMTV